MIDPKKKPDGNDEETEVSIPDVDSELDNQTQKQYPRPDPERPIVIPPEKREKT